MRHVDRSARFLEISQMKLPLAVLLLCVSLILFFSCTGTKSNDKHPKVPYLRDIITEKYNAKRLEFEYSNQIGNYLLRQFEGWPEDSLTLFNLTSGRLKTFPIRGRRKYIDELQGYIYTSVNDSVFFRYGLPAFTEELIELRYFQSCRDSIVNQNPRLAQEQVYAISNSIDSVRIRSKALCMTSFWDRQHHLLRGVGRDFVIRSNGAKVDLPECSHVMPSNIEWNSFLKPFDEVVLEYAKSGYHSNLFGEPVNLYYYRFEIGSSTILFKDLSYNIQFYRTSDHRVILVDGLDIFEFTDR
jgi:hypothetical protein